MPDAVNRGPQPNPLHRLGNGALGWVILIFTLGSLIVPNTGHGATLRVRKDGTGNYTTIQAAVNAMAARDTVLVGPGNYQERIAFPVGKSGIAGSLTTLMAETNGTVETWGFDTANCNYLRIQGFNITVPTNTPSNPGIYIRSSNLEIVSNYVHDVPGFGMRATGNPVNNKIIGNRIYNVGIAIFMYGTNWLVEANDIERLHWYAPLGDADYIIFFGVNHVIRNNFLHGTVESEIGDAHVDGFSSWDNNGEFIHHIRIEGNRVIDFYHQGFIAAAAYHSNSFDIVICNNIFRGAASIGVDAFNGLRDVKVYNNVFMDIYSIGIEIDRGATGEVYNNIFYNVTAWDAETSRAIGSKNIWYRPGTTLGARFNGDLVNVNPQFVDAASGNFRLKTNSPAIDAGVATTNLTVDFDGAARPQGAGWDIGIYEHVSGAVDTTPPVIISPKIQNGMFAFMLSGGIGHSYGLLASSNLVNWVQVTTVTLTNGSVVVTRPLTGCEQFYRAVLLP